LVGVARPARPAAAVPQPAGLVRPERLAAVPILARVVRPGAPEIVTLRLVGAARRERPEAARPAGALRPERPAAGPVLAWVMRPGPPEIVTLRLIGTVEPERRAAEVPRPAGVVRPERPAAVPKLSGLQPVMMQPSWVIQRVGAEQPE
jgi:hypothetical protein